MEYTIIYDTPKTQNMKYDFSAQNMEVAICFAKWKTNARPLKIKGKDGECTIILGTKAQFKEVFKENIRKTFCTENVYVSSELQIVKKDKKHNDTFSYVGSDRMERTINYVWRYVKKYGHFYMGCDRYIL